MEKYKLGKRESNGLYRVIALKDFGEVSKGDIGGFVESENNLSQTGSAWISGDAQISGNARIYEGAQIYGDAQIYEDARIYGDALVKKSPIIVSGLTYPVTITETHIFIGCQGHLKKRWHNFTDGDIYKMNGEKATFFWGKYKKHILWLAYTHN